MFFIVNCFYWLVCSNKLSCFDFTLLISDSSVPFVACLLFCIVQSNSFNQSIPNNDNISSHPVENHALSFLLYFSGLLPLSFQKLTSFFRRLVFFYLSKIFHFSSNFFLGGDICVTGDLVSKIIFCCSVNDHCNCFVVCSVEYGFRFNFFIHHFFCVPSFGFFRFSDSSKFSLPSVNRVISILGCGIYGLVSNLVPCII